MFSTKDMESLFIKLFTLRLRHADDPLEDYLTEIFAYCLKLSRSFLGGFLENILIYNELTQVVIKTQESFKALKDHDEGSRPDIVIYLKGHTIIIEMKVGAREGDKQLQRYAEHLDRIKGEKTLIYITRDYDKKSKKEITKNCINKINFHQLRWYQLYPICKAYSKDSLINEFIKIMELTNLSSTNKFSPLDIISLTNFSRVKKMMDETIYGEVSEKFEKIAGGISQNSVSMTQLRDHDRYIYLKYKNNLAWIGLGYWLNSFNEKEYPELKFICEVSPKSEKYDEIKTIMKKIHIEKPEWQEYNLDIENSWSGIVLSTNLKEFLNKENHLSEIKTFFLNSIEKYAQIENEFNELI